jgi:hypothetical protein
VPLNSSDIVTEDLSESRTKGFWCSFTGSGNFITASTCNSNTDFDAYLELYDGDCASNDLSLEIDNDDDPSCSLFDNFASLHGVQTKNGTEHFLKIGGGKNATGNFELSFENFVPVSSNASPMPMTHLQMIDDIFTNKKHIVN